MSSILEILRQADQVAKPALDLVGRSLSVELGIVTDNNDPEGLRRIKVTLASKGAQTNTDWLYRVLFSPVVDPPLPQINQTVIVAFLEGDNHQGIYLGNTVNQVNPALDKGSVQDDYYDAIPGDRLQKTAGQHTITTGADLTITGDGITHVYPKTVHEDVVRLAAGAGLERWGLSIERGIPGISPDRLICGLNNGNGVLQAVTVARGANFNPQAPIVPDIYQGYPDNSVS